MEMHKINKKVTVKGYTDSDTRQLGPIVSQYDKTESTAGQTTINLSFAVNQDQAKSFKLWVDGRKLVLGTSTTFDFYFSNVSAGFSSTVVLNAPIGSANLNIEYELVGVRESGFNNPASVMAVLNQSAVYHLGFSEVVGAVALPNTIGIPADNTIPQSNEGTEIFTVTITPKRVGAYLCIEASALVAEETDTSNSSTLALFKDSDVNAVKSDSIFNAADSTPINQARLLIKHRELVTSLTPITFKVRAGSDNGACVLNEPSANGTDYTLGNTISSWIQVTESPF